mgnify:CR=1 FL=1
MDSKEISQFKKVYGAKTSDELRKILDSGALSAYTPEAIEAIRQVLKERDATGVDTPIPATAYPDPAVIQESECVVSANNQQVILTDVCIPFGRLIIIIFKWMLASIPAVLLMWLLFAFIMLVFGAGVGGCASLFIR